MIAHQKCLPGVNIAAPLRRQLAGLLAAAMVCASPVAQAVSADVAVAVDNIRFMLIDLDPNDNIAPGITFTDSSGYRDANLAWPELSDRSNGGPGDASISYRGNLAESYSDHTRTSSRVSLVTQHAHTQSYSASGQQEIKFTLTPHTGLTFSADGRMSVDTQDVSFVNAGLLVQFEFDTVKNGATYQARQAWSPAMGTDGDRSLAMMRQVATTDTAGTGSLLVMTSVYVTSVSAVPEPATGGMLMIGAVLVGAVVRRRRS